MMHYVKAAAVVVLVVAVLANVNMFRTMVLKLPAA
jgi:hypothetical protein